MIISSCILSIWYGALSAWYCAHVYMYVSMLYACMYICFHVDMCIWIISSRLCLTMLVSFPTAWKYSRRDLQQLFFRFFILGIKFYWFWKLCLQETLNYWSRFNNMFSNVSVCLHKCMHACMCVHVCWCVCMCMYM